MRYRSLLPSALGLGMFWMTACGDDTSSGPSAAEPAPTASELAVASNTWITRANMPGNRTNLAAVTLKNSAGQSIVYAIGGEYRRVPKTTVTAYNVATNTWTFRRALPVALAGTNGAGVIGGKIYISGGYSDYGGAFPHRALYMYDPATNTWTRKREIPVVELGGGDKYYGMGNGVTGVINNKLYVVSGCFQAQEPWGYFETCNPLLFRYNPVTNYWVRLRSPFAGVPTVGPLVGGVIGGKFYVIGQSPYTREAHFEVYDPSTNQWTPRTSLRLARPGAATAVLNAKLFLMGGSRYNAATDGFETVAITLMYDPITDAWSQRAPMPTPRSGIAASTALLNGQPRIEVVGGIAPGNNIQYIP
jgi:N-acetylneuraminic acid mutarotase